MGHCLKLALYVISDGFMWGVGRTLRVRMNLDAGLIWLLIVGAVTERGGRKLGMQEDIQPSHTR